MKYSLNFQFFKQGHKKEEHCVITQCSRF